MRREMERRSDVVVESNEICPITQSVEATKQHEDKSMGEKMKDAIKSMIPDALKKDHSSSGNTDEKEKGNETSTRTMTEDTGVSKITSTVSETPDSVTTTVTEHIEKFHG